MYYGSDSYERPDFRGTKATKNLAKLLGVPAPVIKKYLKPVYRRPNPFAAHMEPVDYYNVEEAQAFFATPEGQAAMKEKIKKDPVPVKIMGNCSVVWTTFAPGQAPTIHKAAGRTVTIKGKFASFQLEDGTKVRKAITSFAFACTNGIESITYHDDE